MRPLARFRRQLLLLVAVLLLLLLLLLLRKPPAAAAPSRSPPALCIVRGSAPRGSFLLGHLRTAVGPVQIAVFSPHDVISSTILRTGTWQPDITAGFEKMLLADSSLHLIDIGANLGVYSLLAARHGRRVIAVDANRALTERLWHSAQLNGFLARLKVVCNAVADARGQHRLIAPDQANVGHAWLGPEDALQGGALVTAVCLDDLLPLVEFRRALLKIDIEGHEAQALQGAARLFAAIDIAAVFMEWRWVAREQSDEPAGAICRFLRARAFEAFPHASSSEPLDYRQFRDWPPDVVWKKRAV